MRSQLIFELSHQAVRDRFGTIIYDLELAEIPTMITLFLNSGKKISVAKIWRVSVGNAALRRKVHPYLRSSDKQLRRHQILIQISENTGQVSTDKAHIMSKRHPT